jgi:multidrug efflux pump subunit AcrB
VLIGDVADVRIGPGVPKLGRGSVNAQPAVSCPCRSSPQTNTLELTERIDETLAEIQETLPPGMDDQPGVFRQATSSRRRSTT